jgi:hypothetical protein
LFRGFCTSVHPWLPGGSSGVPQSFQNSLRRGEHLTKSKNNIAKRNKNFRDVNYRKAYILVEEIFVVRDRKKMGNTLFLLTVP